MCWIGADVDISKGVLSTFDRYIACATSSKKADASLEWYILTFNLYCWFLLLFHYTLLVALRGIIWK